MKTNKTHKQSGKNLEKICTKSLIPELLTNPGCSKKYQMNAMAMFYDHIVSYMNDMNFVFMNFIEKQKIINRNEKVEKLNDIMTCISATKSLTCLFLYETLVSKYIAIAFILSAS